MIDYGPQKTDARGYLMICHAHLELDEIVCFQCDRRWSATEDPQCVSPTIPQSSPELPFSHPVREHTKVKEIPVSRGLTGFEQALLAGDPKAVRLKALRDCQKALDAGLDIRRWLRDELIA